MADSMDKASVIWPANYAKDEKAKVLAKDLEKKWNDVMTAVEAKLGYQPDFKLATSLRDDVIGKKKNAAEKRDCSGFNPNEAYGKVGVVGNNLVFRAKQPKTLGDIEYDAIIAKNYQAQLGKANTRKNSWKYWSKLKLDDLYTTGAEKMRKQFYDFAKKEFNAENYEFLAALAGWDAATKRPADKTKIPDWNKDIYNTFISKKAPKQVNLKDANFNGIEKYAKTGDWAKIEFKDAETEIKGLIANDTFRRWGASELDKLKAEYYKDNK